MDVLAGVELGMHPLGEATRLDVGEGLTALLSLDGELREVGVLEPGITLVERLEQALLGAADDRVDVLVELEAHQDDAGEDGEIGDDGR